MSDINCRMPAVALRGLVCLPDMILHFDVSRKKSIAALEAAMVKDQMVFLVAQKDPDEEDPKQEDLYTAGAMAKVKQIVKMPENMVRVVAEGKFRAELDEMILKRSTLAKEAFLHSPLYEKMQVIIKDCLDKDESDEEISDREWQEFVIGMDMQWNNAITDLCAKYQLSKEELHLVCLSLAGFPFSHLEYLLHLSRRTLYRKKSALLKRMGAEQNCEFEEILQKK